MSGAAKNKKPFSFGKLVVYIVLAVWALTTVFPFVWVVINSFKPSAEVLRNSFSLPEVFTLENYTNAFSNQNILVSYKNSLIISGTVTIAVMILATMMAFSLTRYQFKLKRFALALLSASLMIPVFSTIIPVYKIMSQLGWISTYQAVILPQIAGNLSFATIVMMGFLRGLPLEMEEAAYMEGAGVTKVFTKIIIPLCRPSLATVAIFCFLWSYNDLFTQKILISREKMFPISNLLEHISSKYGTDFGLMAASVTLIVVPVLIVYIFLQKNIVKGLTAGAIKG